QAEDGIRDFHVTGVQTCALPISKAGRRIQNQLFPTPDPLVPKNLPSIHDFSTGKNFWKKSETSNTKKLSWLLIIHNPTRIGTFQIGRASCREKGETSESDEC